jgi:hypothetical protein
MPSRLLIIKVQLPPEFAECFLCGIEQSQSYRIDFGLDAFSMQKVRVSVVRFQNSEENSQDVMLSFGG